MYQTEARPEQTLRLDDSMMGKELKSNGATWRVHQKAGRRHTFQLQCCTLRGQPKATYEVFSHSDAERVTPILHDLVLDLTECK